MKKYSTLSRKKVTILGISTIFGKLSALLLKQSPHVSRLSLYDDNNISVAHDVSDINTTCKVTAFQGRDQLRCALQNSDVVLIGDSKENKLFDTDFLKDEAPIMIEYAQAIGEAAKCAIIVVAATPVNSLLPIFVQQLIDCDVFDNNKILGSTSVDNMRANKLGGLCLKTCSKNVVLPVVGGSSPDTRVPLFSQAKPKLECSTRLRRKITSVIKNAETEIEKQLWRKESVNRAYATVNLLHSIICGLRGEPNIVDIALTRTLAVPGTTYFSLPVVLSEKGICHRFPLPCVPHEESLLIAHAAQKMCEEVEKGIKIYHQIKGNWKTEEKNGFLDDIAKKLNIKSNTKVEYELMSRKKNFNFEPERNPMDEAILLPYLENETFDQDCCPLKLPEPPSTPRRYSEPVKIENCNIASSTCFAPVVKEKTNCKPCKSEICESQKPPETSQETKSVECCEKKYEMIMSQDKGKKKECPKNNEIKTECEKAPIKNPETTRNTECESEPERVKKLRLNFKKLDETIPVNKIESIIKECPKYNEIKTECEKAPVKPLETTRNTECESEPERVKNSRLNYKKLDETMPVKKIDSLIKERPILETKKDLDSSKQILKSIINFKISQKDVLNLTPVNISDISKKPEKVRVLSLKKRPEMETKRDKVLIEDVVEDISSAKLAPPKSIGNKIDPKPGIVIEESHEINKESPLSKFKGIFLAKKDSVEQIINLVKEKAKQRAIENQEIEKQKSIKKLKKEEKLEEQRTNKIKPIVKVIKEEKLEEEITTQTKPIVNVIKEEKISKPRENVKLYAPKCPSEYLHGQYVLHKKDKKIKLFNYVKPNNRERLKILKNNIAEKAQKLPKKKSTEVKIKNLYGMTSPNKICRKSEPISNDTI